MLKIKDNVDLKELEKFGFTFFENGCGTTGYAYDTTKGSITIIEKDREFNNEYIDERKIPVSQALMCNLELFYDLIKAGFVEKVDDNNGK